MSVLTSSAVLERLRAAADPDEQFREFTRRISVTNYPVLGVRTPALRRLAREIAALPGADEYLLAGLHSGPASDGSEPGNLFYEEVMLYGLVLAIRARKMPLEEVFDRLESLIPLFDSWAHVDVIIGDMKIFARHRDEVFRRFAPLKTHPGEFTKRTFVILLMDYFLDDDHVDFALRELAGVPQGQYYVDMALAWALSVALVKHYDRTERLLRVPAFSRFVHNKAIQKARESYRITPDRKEYLNSLKQP